MATTDELILLRQYINETDDANGWDDARLEAYLTSSEGSIPGAASLIWTAKASAAASLVDVSESGSSRKLGDLSKNALEMAAHFDKLVSGGTDASIGPVIHRIRRGF